MFELLLRITLGLSIGGLTQTGQGVFEDQQQVDTQVIALETLQVEEAIDIVGKVFFGELTITGGHVTDQLILRGHPSEIQAVVELIAQIDLPNATIPDPETRTAYIDIHTYPTGALLPLLRVLPHSSWREVAVDVINHRLVVRDTPEGIEAIRSLVAEVDKPIQTLRLEFSFLRGDIGNGASGKAVELPPAMQPIAKTLANNGFGSLALMAPLIVHADVGNRFDSKAVLVAAGENLEFILAGRAIIQPNTETVQMQLEARVNSTVVAAPRGSQKPNPVFKIETTVTAKLGSYAILAAAPGTTEQGSAIALVVRVTKD